MKGLKLDRNGSEYSVDALRYGLRIDADRARADVVISGTTVARLDMRSAVNSLTAANEVVTDTEPELPVFEGAVEQGELCVFTWRGKTALWSKKYTLSCTAQRFAYNVSVSGRGRVDSVNYFSGDITALYKGSGYEFSEGFNPCRSWFEEENYYFKANQSCYRWSVLMIPPMHCYAFRTEGLHEWLGLGAVARRGEHNFNSLTYNFCGADWHSAFYLSTDQHGHTHVDGEWVSPAIIGYAANDELDVMRRYSDYYFSSGIARPKKRELTPRFWKGPLLCGWIDQCRREINGRTGSELACEEEYEYLLGQMRKYDLHPTALIIDDKWQREYATGEVDTEKWPDLRAFVDKRHAEGINTLLWFKLWDPEGWPRELCVTADNGDVRIDPSTPEFKAHIERLMHTLLSSDEGCYNCDGVKIDFAFYFPIGRGFTTRSGRYGCELLYELMAHIYDCAKRVKPNALINCSPCHPYFSHICDQARVHDYAAGNRCNYEDLAMRARMFALAMPGTLIDTDNAGFASRRDTMRWMLNQQDIGVPDCYCLTPHGEITDDDFYAISAVWKEYSARIDREYAD